MKKTLALIILSSSLVGPVLAQQSPSQTILRDGTGDSTQANVTNGNVHTNISRMNDAAVSMGVGNTGTGVQRVIEATDSQLSAGVGATGDAAATAGSTGSINAKLRLLTDLVNQVLTELGQKTEPTNTQAVSAASLPLPTGAATAANQDGIIKDGTGDTTQANVINGRLQVENTNPNLAADNSTNSTSKVPVLAGVATTAAPTYTTTNQVPLSLNTSGGLRVDGSGVTQPVSGSVSLGAAIPAGTNNIGDVDVLTLPAIPTGTNSIGQVTANAGTNLNTSALLTTTAHDAAFGTAGTADAQVRSIQGVASMIPVLIQPQAVATGGADALSYLSVGTTEDKHAVKATAGTLYSITATNTNAAVRYLKCENDTSVNTAPGTDTPELRIAVPGNTTGAGVTTQLGPVGWAFSTALTCWLVTGAADSDVAEVAANEMMVFYTYK